MLAETVTKKQNTFGSFSPVPSFLASWEMPPALIKSVVCFSQCFSSAQQHPPRSDPCGVRLSLNPADNPSDHSADQRATCQYYCFNPARSPECSTCFDLEGHLHFAGLLPPEHQFPRKPGGSTRDSSDSQWPPPTSGWGQLSN